MAFAYAHFNCIKFDIIRIIETMEDASKYIAQYYYFVNIALITKYSINFLCYFVGITTFLT